MIFLAETGRRGRLPVPAMEHLPANEPGKSTMINIANQ